MCNQHFKGVQMQRLTAIHRAQSELASQLGVDVDSIMMCSMNSDGKGACQARDGFETHQTNVRAMIKEMYKDRKTGALYVWVVQY